MVELRVLGPLEVRVGDTVVPLGAPKQQTVLALLAVNAGRVVGLDELVDELWPEHPPASAVENVRSYAASVRRLFESVEPGGNRVTKRSSGYLLAAGPHELDLLAFLEDSGSGRAALARGDLSAAADRLTSARSRWRGRMLAGVPYGPVLTVRCAVLEEERLALTEDHAELELALGQPSRAVVMLREHVQTHPLRERGHTLIMLALHESGDVAGALAEYAAARSALVDQLGIEPGPELQRVHAAILKRDMSSAVRFATGPMPPRELPPDAGCFVGRGEEVARIRAELTPQDRPTRQRPSVIVLYGQGGVGKSALAVHAAHQVAKYFPDGQLYLDLLGSTPGLRSIAPVDALSRFLRSLGVPRDQIPADEADAAARFRTLTAERRLLVVLDNAKDERQILPLLPASGVSAVFITARQPLVAIDAEWRGSIPALSLAEGTVLLRRSARDISVDKATAETIVGLCEGLPLAIRISAGRMIGRPDLSPDELAERLADRRRRLDELEGSAGASVRSCIGVGYESLSTGSSNRGELAARIFRGLGVFNVPDVHPGVVSAMFAEPVDLVQAALDHLVTTQLLIASTGGRYRLHDLVRLVAAEQAEPDRGAVNGELLYRAIAYYAGCLLRAEDLLRPGRVPDFGAPPAPCDIQFPNFGDAAEAWNWVQAEFENLLAVAEQASELSGPGRRFAVLICHSTWYNLHRNLEWRNARRLGQLLLMAAHRHHDRNMEGWAYLLIGRDNAEQGDLDSAIKLFERTLAIHRDTVDHHGIVLALNALGIAATHRWDFAAAEAYYKDCVRLARANHLDSQEAGVLYNLGNLQVTAGRWAEAKVTFDQSLSIAIGWNDLNAIGGSRSLLAIVNCHFGDLEEALSNVEIALGCFRATGDLRRECFALLVSAEAHHRRGDDVLAMSRAQAALTLARSSDYPYGEASALRHQAKVLATLGEEAEAAQIHAQAAEAYAGLHALQDTVLEALLAETVQTVVLDRSNP